MLFSASITNSKGQWSRIWTSLTYCIISQQHNSIHSVQNKKLVVADNRQELNLRISPQIIEIFINQRLRRSWLKSFDVQIYVTWFFEISDSKKKLFVLALQDRGVAVWRNNIHQSCWKGISSSIRQNRYNCIIPPTEQVQLRHPSDRICIIASYFQQKIYYVSIPPTELLQLQYPPEIVKIASSLPQKRYV